MLIHVHTHYKAVVQLNYEANILKVKFEIEKFLFRLYTSSKFYGNSSSCIPAACST